MKNFYDIIIIGSGPAGLGTAFQILKNRHDLSIAIIDKASICSGGLLNDCKQNYTYPICFSEEYWNINEATELLTEVQKYLNPKLLNIINIDIYKKRAEKIGCNLINVKQAHIGTDRSKILIENLFNQLKKKGVDILLNVESSNNIDINAKTILLVNGNKLKYNKLVIAPGRKGFSFLQEIMDNINVKYIDNSLDIGIRIEAKAENYSIVKDYYDPKFYFPKNVRTFCTNSNHALVILEKYTNFYLVNGHALSNKYKDNGLINFAMLKTIKLETPLRSGQQMAIYLARIVDEICDGRPIMQRVGDFRIGKRSKIETFNNDLYDFKPTCQKASAGDLGLVVPSRIMKDIWDSMKYLDCIVPGILHPSTIMYYPEIKLYANKPSFIDEYFAVTNDIYLTGDGAGTSRGITGAWASGMRVANGILKKI